MYRGSNGRLRRPVLQVSEEGESEWLERRENGAHVLGKRHPVGDVHVHVGASRLTIAMKAFFICQKKRAMHESFFDVMH